MPLLSEKERAQLAKHFDSLTGDVTIAVFTQQEGPLGPPGQECDLCQQTRQLAQELATTSPRIHVEVHDFLASDDPAVAEYGIERIPALVLLGPDRRDVGIRFYGIPAGYELATIIGDVIRLSTAEPDLKVATLERLARLDGQAHIKVFVTPTCPYCPHAAYLAHQMAMASARVLADAIEATEFPELVDRYQVMGVPKIVINEHTEVEGAVPETEFLDKVVSSATIPAVQATA
jgi:glutaredoxin-like protein